MNNTPFEERVVSFFHPEGMEVEMLRYRPNKASYKLAFASIILFALAFCVHYSGTTISGNGGSFNFLGYPNLGFWNFVDLLLNILLLLLFLTAAMEMQAYSVVFGIIAIVGGLFQCIRPLCFSLEVFLSGNMSVSIYVLSTGFYVASGILLITAGILAIIRGKALREYLQTVAPMQNERVGK